MSSALTSLHHAIVLAAREPSSQILERRGERSHSHSSCCCLVPRVTRNLKRPIQFFFQEIKRYQEVSKMSINTKVSGV